MEGNAFSPGIILGSSPAMDIDFMDELLLDGCWLETMDGSELFQHSPSNFNTLFDNSLPWPASDNSKDNCSNSPYQNEDQDGKKISPVYGEPGRDLASTQPLRQTMANVEGFGPSTVCVNEGSELRRRWWIGPMANQGTQTSVMERLIKALDYIQDFTKDKDVLIQIWVPVNRGGNCVLTTNDQPFSLNPTSRRLSRYRDISVDYQFSAEKNSKEMMGLPSRVYLGKVPEWTPDVRFFRSDEYPRVDHAQEYDVRGTLALPVFEQGSRTCLGVIEVVMTKQKVKYQSEIENVCKALKAVDLRSSEVYGNRDVESNTRSYEAALPEIREVLKSACETHRLPLAQTWVPCIQQGKGGCRHSEENYSFCVSTVDDACHVADPRVHSFHEASSEHHLLKGQGVAGQAFLTNQPCFHPDITTYPKTEYPLSHHARMFGLCAAVAIRLRSIYTGTADFVLEFFLPMECKDHEEQKKMLTSLSIIIQQVCRTLRVVTDDELEEEGALPSYPLVVPSDTQTKRESTLKPAEKDIYPVVQQNGPVNSTIQKDNVAGELHKKSRDFRQDNLKPSDKESFEPAEQCATFAEGSFSSVSTGKTREKKRVKAEKTITLEVLRQHFAGSLKDAAKNLGVCPTTLKRICRQHGINRWPSRKIKKVGHSLQKLQHVIDSVQGASGAIQIDSLFLDLSSPNVSATSPNSHSKLSDTQMQIGVEPVGGVHFSPPPAESKSPSSSCSQSSSSSQCFSSGRQQDPSGYNAVNIDDPLILENATNGLLKRVRSDVELHGSSQEPPKRLLPRSQSHISVNEIPNPRTVIPSMNPVSPPIVEGEALRVKVTYADEKIRFRLQNNRGLKHLWHEIARRFNIDDTSKFDLKYLDDDSEWVLLTCDADLDECRDVCRSSQGNTVKLSIQLSHHRLGSSFKSSASP